MFEVKERQSIDDALRLATDLCLALGAFAVGLTGIVHVYVSEAVPPDDVPRRMERLARSCLVHPAAHGRELFWNAEVSTDSGFADRSLACAVLPVWTGNTQVGLLGIVDTWLPEPDDDQRAGLVALAADLGRVMPLVAGDETVAAEPQPATAPPGGEPSVTEAPRPWTPEMVSPGPGPVATEPPVRAVATEAQGAEEPAVSAPTQPAAEASDAEREAGLGSLPKIEWTAPSPGSTAAPDAGLAPPDGFAPPTDLPFRTDVPQPGVGTTAWSTPGTGAGQSSAVGLGYPLGSEDVAAHGGTSAPPAESVFAGAPRPGMPGVVRASSALIEAADLVASLDDAVVCLDGSGIVALANRAADVLFGLGPGRSLVGSPLPEPPTFRTEDGQVMSRELQPALLVLRDGVARTAQMLVGEKEAQRRFAVSARVFTVGGGGGALLVMHDTTAEWMEQQRLSRYAMYDPLTGLANRYLLLEELRRMLQGLGRRGGSVALVYLDLDKFKLINDEHGHDMGDEVLGAVARRLRGAVRGDDVVARLGGDEFVIAHASAESRPDGDLVVSRLRKVLSAPFRVRGSAFDVGASIGWVSTDRADVGPDALLARADRAMYQSKRDRAARRPPT